MNKRILTIVHSIDKNTGERIATVPLTNSGNRVTLLEQDLDMLIRAGFPLTWRFANKQVATCGKQKVLVARFMVAAKKGDKVLFKDKDPCNLRRDNIAFADQRYIMMGDVIIQHVEE